MLGTDKKERKAIPIATGCLDYFPLALAEIARVSLAGNRQHNGDGQPLHWDRTKSADHADCLMRHFIEREGVDIDGMLHLTKVAWRALAMLQLKMEKAQEDAATPFAAICVDGSKTVLASDVEYRWYSTTNWRYRVIGGTLMWRKGFGDWRKSGYGIEQLPALISTGQLVVV
jgi:hypothetical protein